MAVTNHIKMLVAQGGAIDAATTSINSQLATAIAANGQQSTVPVGSSVSVRAGDTSYGFVLSCTIQFVG
jgi:hypothetical protein